ncbi:MAG: hypothetical protein K6T88_13435 [Bacillus sp. (in: Bacteria)]|nr:hypothetical protein [Bacillus sp. (in: firmicutes)]
MSIPKGYIEEILGMSFRARHKEDIDSTDQFINPIIHRQIHGNKVYIPLRLWNE